MFYGKPKDNSTNAAYEKFKSEGLEQSNKNPSQLHIVSKFERTFDNTTKDGLDESSSNTDYESLSVGQSHDPDRIRRDRFIEGISKDLLEFDESLNQNALFVEKSREQLKRFKSFTQNAQIDTDVMYRLRDDSVELSDELARANKKIDSIGSELKTETAKSQAASNRYSEVRSGLEKAREEIINLIERDAGFRVELERYASQASQRETELLHANRAIEKFEVENRNLNEQGERIYKELDVMSDHRLEFEKSAEELVAKLSIEQDLNENLVTKNKSLTQEFEASIAENVELASRLNSAEHEAKESVKRNKDKFRITDEELYSLRTRTEGLQSQLRIKSQMNSELQEQSKNSIAEAKVSKEATKDLHNRLVETMRQHEHDQEHISDLNGEIGTLNQRFEKLLAEMEHSRSENIQLRRSLKLQRQSWNDPLAASAVGKGKNSDPGDLDVVQAPPGTKPH